MANPTNTSARFRQRKISVKQTLAVLWQSDIPDLEDEQPRELQQVETGVEKGEEEEHHLQAAINASIAVSTGAKVEQVYIPTPDASKVWKDYSKYYTKDFSEPSTYIRLSATVEETAGCPYCMDETDDEFLTKFNTDNKQPCTEDEFEMVMDKFEQIIAEKQPFLSMDASQVLSFSELSRFIVEQITEAENDPANPEFLLASINRRKSNKPHKSKLDSFKQFGEPIYEYWKERKIERKGGPIAAMLKFEESEKDDSDPYVCFRRRELRQVRKTRRTDTLSSEKLRSLLSEMESAKRLMEMVAHREKMRREALQLELDIFESRCKMKDLKRTLSIKGDDEDLVTHKKRKPLPPVKTEVPKPVVEAAPAAEEDPITPNVHPVHQVPPNVRLPASKIPDMELVSLEHVASEKELAIKAAVKEKLRSRAQADKDWVNYTDNPYIPFCDYFDTDETSRNALNIIQPSHAAYSSIATAYPPPPDTCLTLPLSEQQASMAGLEGTSFLVTTEIEDGDMKVVSLTSQKDGQWPVGGRRIPRGTAVSLRKRVGRGGRIMVDRKGLIRRPPTEDSIYSMSELSDWTDTLTFGSSSIEDAYEQHELGVKLDRLHDRYKYDSEIQFDHAEYPGDDPSRLNGISEETQSIRFGSMLMSKAYDSYWDAYKQRQQQLSLMHKRLQQQQAQQAQQAQQQAQQAQAQQQNDPAKPGQDQAGRQYPPNAVPPNGVRRVNPMAPGMNGAGPNARGPGPAQRGPMYNGAAAGVANNGKMAGANGPFPNNVNPAKKMVGGGGPNGMRPSAGGVHVAAGNGGVSGVVGGLGQQGPHVPKQVQLNNQ